MATVVDVLENFLGQELNTSLPPLTKLLSNRQLVDLTDQVFFFFQNQDPPAYDEPVISLMPREVGPNEIIRMGAASYVESLTNQLLYYPRIYVFHDINPFFYALMQEPWRALDEYVKAYSGLRAAIQSGTVVVGSWPDSNRTEPYIRELNDLAANDQELQAYVRTLARKGQWPTHLSEEAVIDEYHITQVIAAETNTGWTAPYRALLEIHEYQMSRTQQALTSAERVEICAARVLADLQLPAIEKLKVNDLMKIRTDEEAFVEWRKELTGIARAVLQEERSVEGLLGREFRQQAQEKLMPRVTAIRDKMKAKSLSQYLKDGLIGFCAGLTAALATEPPVETHSFTASMQKPLAGGAAGLLFSILTKRVSAKDRLLCQFYSLFEEPQPAWRA
jgi:hypothetical protein